MKKELDESEDGFEIESRRMFRDTEIAVARSEEGLELRVAGEPIFTTQVHGGFFIAAGFAFSPERSLTRLGERMVEARQAEAAAAEAHAAERARASVTRASREAKAGAPEAARKARRRGGRRGR